MADERTYSKTRTETGTASTDGPDASRTAYSGSTSDVGVRTGPDWSAAIWAGIIAGAAFLMLELIMVPLFLGMSGWGPPRMIAAIVMGEGVLPPPATFDFGIVIVAMIVHFVLSIGYAVALAFVVQRWGTGKAIVAGAVFGLLLYLVNFYGFTAIFPWFAMARNWVSIFAHIMFGAIAAWAYKAIALRK